eukprot:7379010-Prymnesium_polylepis.2
MIAHQDGLAGASDALHRSGAIVRVDAQIAQLPLKNSREEFRQRDERGRRVHVRTHGQRFAALWRCAQG